MNYVSYDSVPYFRECAESVKDEGYRLVELQVVPQNGMVKITVVIAADDVTANIGVADCSKVHHLLAPKLMGLLNKTEDDIMMEVCSPGTERNIKNAAEFEIFTGREIRVWDRTVSDWVSGQIKCADSEKLTLSSDESEKVILYSDIAKAKFLHK